MTLFLPGFYILLVPSARFLPFPKADVAPCSAFAVQSLLTPGTCPVLLCTQLRSLMPPLVSPLAASRSVYNKSLLLEEKTLPGAVLPCANLMGVPKERLSKNVLSLKALSEWSIHYYYSDVRVKELIYYFN